MGMWKEKIELSLKWRVQCCWRMQCQNVFGRKQWTIYAYTLNRSGKSREKGRTPYEIWFDREYSLHHLKIFGSILFEYQQQKRDDRKFGKTSKREIFVGYEDITGNYRVWIPDETWVEISRNVEFYEVTVPEVLIDLNQGEKEEKIL